MSTHDTWNASRRREPRDHVAHARHAPVPAELAGVPGPFQGQAGRSIQAIGQRQLVARQVVQLDVEKQVILRSVGRIGVGRCLGQPIALGDFDSQPARRRRKTAWSSSLSTTSHVASRKRAAGSSSSSSIFSLLSSICANDSSSDKGSWSPSATSTGLLSSSGRMISSGRRSSFTWTSSFSSPRARPTAIVCSGSRLAESGDQIGWPWPLWSRRSG